MILFFCVKAGSGFAFLHCVLLNLFSCFQPHSGSWSEYSIYGQCQKPEFSFSGQDSKNNNYGVEVL